MKLVIDANIVIAFLITQGKTAELVMNSNYELISPAFVFTELDEHKEELLGKTKRAPAEFEIAKQILGRYVRIVSIPELEPYLAKASKITPDPDDTLYFALALKEKCPIWSNDKKLKTQDSVKVLNTAELLGK